MKIAINPNKIYTSQRRSKFTFALSLVEIFINNVLYSTITCLVKDIIFDIFQNFNPFAFHKICKLYKFQMPFRTLGKIVVQSLK